MTFKPVEKLTEAILQDLPPLCTDGAWGTEMQKRGAKPGEMCDTWNIEQPEKVFEVAKAYVDAGAQIILTNTFSSNRFALATHGLADQAAALCRAGAEISRQAAERRAYVFASMGPTGKMVMMGELDPDEVTAAAAEQAAAFAQGGADAIVIETQADPQEARALLRGCRQGCDLPAGLSFTFDSGANLDRTMMGTTIDEVCALAAQEGASFVGANCGMGITKFIPLARTLAEKSGGLPIWIKGNAGLPKTDKEGRTIFEAGPDVYAQAVPLLLEAGARFIGGCCGSTPEHIRAIAKALEG